MSLKNVFFASILVLVSSVEVSAQNIQQDELPSESSPFLRKLVLQAKAEAEIDFEPTPAIESEALNGIDYQQYRAIRFEPKESIWRGVYPFEVQLFHSGFLYKHPVNIHMIDYKNRVTGLPFNTEYFRYDPPAEFLADEINEDVGFAGFRVHYPLNSETYKDELIAFLGATYFRLIGKNQKYGLSARGIAIDTGMPEGEEFPYFTDFWLIEPANGKQLNVYAKMDSPSMTGIYKFTMGSESSGDTVTDVKAWLFAREDIDKVGLAPFTSMFLYGENSLTKPDDYRPEVHDSDGMMLITSNNERLWRPLDNPNRLRITSLGDKAPKGFGLLQRDIQYEHYVDSEAHYHQRPGFWVTPYKGFNQGRLELVEIPTNSETHDNIVAYWVNDKPIKQGDSIHVHYELKTVSADAYAYDKSKVIRTLQGSDRLPGEEVDEDNLTRRFIVDFTVPDGAVINPEDLAADISATNGNVSQVRVFKTNFDHEIRATFLFTPESERSVNDMRLLVTHKGKPISEVWTYVYEK
ncbi:MAG: glucan biosynthesis protein G [Paraglaciecola sp.]|uniref:glucan biosynthesis protein n=1 Tax=Paraglaciecola sp. TaxID=1920173 RepID=UPI003296D2A1